MYLVIPENRLRRYAPSSQGEGRRLPLPASLVHALSRDTSFKLHDGASTAGAEGMGGRITIERANSGSSATKNTRSSSSELLHENEAPSESFGVILFPYEHVVGRRGA